MAFSKAAAGSTLTLTLTPTLTLTLTKAAAGSALAHHQEEVLANDRFKAALGGLFEMIESDEVRIGLQPYVTEAATVCDRGCNRM